MTITPGSTSGARSWPAPGGSAVRVPSRSEGLLLGPLGQVQTRAGPWRGPALGIFTPELERMLPLGELRRKPAGPPSSWLDAGAGRSRPSEHRGWAFCAGRRPRSCLRERRTASRRSRGRRVRPAALVRAARPGQPAQHEPARADREPERGGGAARLRSPAARGVRRLERPPRSRRRGRAGRRGDSINNGAYDNASGVAILLEVAQGARPPAGGAPQVRALPRRHRGGIGPARLGFFAHHPPVPTGRIVADINLDMFLMLYPLRDVVAFGAEHSSLGLVEEAARELGIAVSPDPFPEEVDVHPQ